MSGTVEMKRYLARLRAGRRFAVAVRDAARTAPAEVRDWLAPFLVTLPADLAPQASPKYPDKRAAWRAAKARQASRLTPEQREDRRAADRARYALSKRATIEHGGAER